MTAAPATAATVLIVEDEEALLLSMAHHLRREGYDVLTPPAATTACVWRATRSPTSSSST